ncbi:hypothetical protein M0638_18950 [Roseomonas sp. NAR14]|uniref:Glutamine amidotransferase domain-containing protein n=1 Tax=Roseomonas acroporae TaxID=2937791 RepID=A0A9X1YC47_9PROT|nr:hypothetical protein [Roseomonas acroporae]MCK8786458.1 hypothetical protein [Roseomonas acroporae]
MRQAVAGIDFAPILPVWLLAALALLALLALAPAVWRRARGAWWRALAFALLLLALGNPRLVEETREMRPDIALLVVDRSDSARLGARGATIEAARREIEARAVRLPDLELRTIEVPEAGRQGTLLFAAAERALADIPRPRLAGVILLSDGQAHDVPAAPPVEAPVHLLLPGRPGETDRRLRVVEAPGFGIVGRSVELRVAIEDLGVPPGRADGPGGSARLTVRRAGTAPRVESVRVGADHRITVPIERGGPTVVEIAAEPLPGEVSELNNRAVVTINGVRDRLRVLLVSGEPNPGERTWRRLLKADPNVDLVHFTILRPPEKDDLTPLNELALIAFPVRELFQQKLRDFDLIVFDRFANRGILPPAYLRNIANYVRQGGALLLSVGPEFVGPTSLALTPLGAVLPVRPPLGAGSVREGAFRPLVTETGARHPVTAGLPGANRPVPAAGAPPGGSGAAGGPAGAGPGGAGPGGAGSDGAAPGWGRWYRSIGADPRAGATVMEAGGGEPLLLLDRVEEGRVALMLSDQIWLWSRGHDGGGPQAELLRRTAHWLMHEPELEEEDLTAQIEDGRLLAERRSLSADPPPEFTVTAPDGTVTRRRPEPGAPGRAGLTMPATLPGVWEVSDGTRAVFAAAAAANPLEIADLRADEARLRPIVEATGGGARWLGPEAAGGEPAVPELRRVSPGRDAAASGGRGWIGLRRNGDHTVTGIAALPLLPPWLALPLVLGTALLAWRREGR